MTSNIYDLCYYRSKESLDDCNHFSIIPNCLAEETEFKRMSSLEKKNGIILFFRIFLHVAQAKTQAEQMSKEIACVHTKTRNQRT